jgi:hypothetical protein
MTALTLEAVTPDVEAAAKTVLATFTIPDDGPDIIPLRPLPHGHMLWDPIAEHARGPVCRSEGSYPVMRLQRGDRSSITAWLQGGGHLGCTPAQSSATAASWWVRSWINAREHVANQLTSFDEAVPPWQDIGHGKWFVAAMRNVEMLPANRTEGFHGTSMHMLHRIVARGMESSVSGVFVRGQQRFGVYHHVVERAHLCSNYMMYSALEHKSGFMYAPLVQIQYPQPDPHGRLNVVRRSSANQNLTYPDVCSVTHIWLHVTHVLEFVSGSRDLFIMAEPRFATHLELDPEDTWKDILQRSREVGTNAE